MVNRQDLYPRGARLRGESGGNALVRLGVTLLIIFLLFLLWLWFTGSQISREMRVLEERHNQQLDEYRALQEERSDMLDQILDSGFPGGGIATPEATLRVNVPAQFNSTLLVQGHELLLGILEGSGIELIGDATKPRIQNTDRGSDQSIFKTIDINGETITADSNNATLRFATGDGLEIAVIDGEIVISERDESDDTTTERGQTVAGASTNNVTEVTEITEVTEVTEVIEVTENTYITEVTDLTEITEVDDNDGMERVTANNNVRLENITDTVTIGTDISDGKLSVMATQQDQTTLSLIALEDQSSALFTAKNPDGDVLIEFDTEGNAVYTGNLTQTGDVQVISGGLDFTGTDQIVFDGFGVESGDNILINPGLEDDLSHWSSSTPSVVNHIENPDFNDTVQLSGWTTTVNGTVIEEEITNGGFETNLSEWIIEGGGVGVIAEYGPTSFGPRAITEGSDGNMWYVAHSGGVVGKITPSGVIEEFATPESLGWGTRITAGPDGNIWYTSMDHNSIGKITTDGVINHYSPTKTWPRDITTGPDGRIWYTTQVQGYVGNITTDGTITEYDIPRSTPGGITVGPDNNIWVTTNARYMFKVQNDGSMEEFGPVTSQPLLLQTGTDGNMWYTSFVGNVIGRLSTDGTYTEFGPTGTNPIDLTVGPDGNMWYTTFGSRTVGVITPNGHIQEYSLGGTGPYGIGTGPDGNIWYTGIQVHRIGKFGLGGAERSNVHTYAFSNGAAKLPPTGSDMTMTQVLSLDSSKTYRFTAYAYVDSTTTISDTHVVLSANGADLPTTFERVTNNWYRLSGEVTGTGGNVKYGVKVKDGNTVYVDNIQMRTIIEANHSTVTFNQASGSSQITAPAGATVDFTTDRAFTPGDYTFSIYAYTDGSVVTTDDAELVFNGNVVTPTITPGANPGWYKLEGSFSVVTEGMYPIGMRVKESKTVYADDATLLKDVAGTPTVHTTGDTAITHADSNGSAQVTAIGTTDVSFTQDIEIIEEGYYNLVARVYNKTPGMVGDEITSSHVRITLNGNPVGTAISAAGSDWWNVQNESLLTVGTYSVGVTVTSGYQLVVDSFLLHKGAGEDRTFRVVNSGSGLAYLDVESTITANSGRSNKKALIIHSSDYQTENLIEWRDFDGSVLGVVDENGQMGIGTDDPESGISVLKDNESGAAASFVNTSSADTATNSALRLATGSESTGVNARFIQFYAGATGESDGTGVGRIRLNNGGVAYESGGADFAEYFASEQTEYNYEPGDVIALNKYGNADTTTHAYHDRTLGVVSDTAAFVGNARPEVEEEGSKYIMVGILGQIETKVSDINGPIKAGDAITTSVIDGHAMRAGETGRILGVALDDFNEDGAQTCKVPLQTPVEAAPPEDTFDSSEASRDDSVPEASSEGQIKESGILARILQAEAEEAEEAVGDVLGESAGGISDATEEAQLNEMIESDLQETPIDSQPSTGSPEDPGVFDTFEEEEIPEDLIPPGSINRQLPRCGSVRVYVNTAWNGTSMDDLLTGLSTNQEQFTQPLEILDERSAEYHSGTHASATVSGQLGSDPVFEDGITVLGTANIFDLAVTNSLNAGLLRINGVQSDPDTGREAAAIDTLTGSLLLQSQAAGKIEIMGGRTVIDKLGGIQLQEGDISLDRGDIHIQEGDVDLESGAITGNESFTGTVTIPAGETSIRVEQEWSTVPVSVTTNAGFRSYTYVTGLDESGFTIEVTEAPVEDSPVYWLAVFGREGEEVTTAIDSNE